MDKRHRINVALKSKSYSKPKRNVYLIEVATEKEIEAIAEFVRRTLVDPRSTIKYYRETPTSPSRNLARPDPVLVSGLDKRYTGRNLRISLAVRPEFATELKRAAALNNFKQIGVKKSECQLLELGESLYDDLCQIVANSWQLMKKITPVSRHHQELHEELEKTGLLTAWAELGVRLARGHYFTNGNKRTALLAMTTFIQACGFRLPAADDKIIFQKWGRLCLEIVVAESEDTLSQALAVEAKKQKFSVLLADCDNQQATTTLEIAKQADLIIQPAGASRADLRPAVKEFHALKEAGIPPSKLLFVVNRVASSAEAQAVYSHLQQAGYQIAETPLYEKPSYRTEQNGGNSIANVRYKNLAKNA
ncbi:4209_t:CDS:2, partial [Racocetra fulgida]